MITFSNIGKYGRIGNQLFQISTLINIARVNKYSYGIPYKNEEKTFWVNDPRGGFQYGLELHKCFDINIPNINDLSFIKHQHKAPQFNYYPSILNIPDNTNIIGYFQSEKFFKENINFIKKEFKFKKEIYETSKNQLHKFKKPNKQLVSVHVRRGDYITIQEHHPMLTYDNYYRTAMMQYNNCDFLFFSDDIKMTKEHFGKKDNYIYVEDNNTYVDLCLMSLCDHHIIANSSFSWWAAWLNETENKKIIAPNVWFGPAHSDLNTSDLIPNRWIKV